jgi:hypothetical protein
MSSSLLEYHNQIYHSYLPPVQNVVLLVKINQFCNPRRKATEASGDMSFPIILAEFQLVINCEM